MKKLAAKTAILLILVLLVSAMTVSAAADEPSKLIALTFDDGPGPYTQELLDGLRERGAHVTFFMLGQNALYYPDTVRHAWEDGHQICSHTYDHKSLKGLSDTEFCNELVLADSALDTAIGHDFDYWLRPPYGDFTDEILSRVGVPCVHWTVDTLDWKTLDADAACAEFISAVRDGSVVLMHDIYSTSVSAALRVIDMLTREGYEFVTVRELLARRGIEAVSGRMYFSAYPGENGTEPALSDPIISYRYTFEGRKVFINGDERASLYYTTDGSIPEPGNYRLYEEPFYIDEDTEVKAICVRSWNGGKGNIISKNIEFAPLRTSSATPLDKPTVYARTEAEDAHTIEPVFVLNCAAVCAAIVLIILLIRSRKHS